MIKRAYEPAIREIGLNPWDGFSDKNKEQLTVIKFLSLEERITGSQPVDLIEQFEQFRSETQEQMRQMQMKIGALTEENIELRDLISKK